MGFIRQPVLKADLFNEVIMGQNQCNCEDSVPERFQISLSEESFENVLQNENDVAFVDDFCDLSQAVSSDF